MKSNVTLRSETKQIPITDVIRKRRWNYIGHALNMSEDKIPNQIFKWTPVGRRKVGRPRETLRRTIKRESTRMGVKDIQELQTLAMNRQKWRIMTSALCASFGSEG
ncbi:hypothetical protein BsWGS_11711 [Bradybaena similaris]